MMEKWKFIVTTSAKGEAEKGEEAARAYLTGYTHDFFGATILRWDEMASQYWIESRFGL